MNGLATDNDFHVPNVDENPGLEMIHTREGYRKCYPGEAAHNVQDAEVRYQQVVKAR
jgi:hypothetical protein